jgi:DNA-binding transcriptional ArsR family regulator
VTGISYATCVTSLLNHRRILLFASIIFVASVFIVSIKFFEPASFNVYVGTAQNRTFVSQITGFYTVTDMIVAVAFSVLAGISGAYVLLSRAQEEFSFWKASLEERRKVWDEVSGTLKDDEKKVYEVMIEAGIVNQSELPEKTGLSKTAVSRCLDLLEGRGLVERRRRGMGNVVSLRWHRGLHGNTPDR